MKHLILQGISKKFADKKLFIDLCYEFSKGSYAIMGPNGVGKSTLLGMIAGALSPDKGKIIINQFDLQTQEKLAKQQLGFVSDKPDFYPFATGREFLEFIKCIKMSNNNAMAMAAIEALELTAALDIKFSEMSLGTQKKMMLVAAMMGDPFVYILDEPCNGLDYSAKQFLLEFIIKNSSEKLFIFSSHDVEFIRESRSLQLRLGVAPNKQLLSLEETS